ncbi:MAG TPA: hypothetical protein DCZ94_09210 [Lentisphaeria bacterium]|nr:MAG: hypothetical protein A2X48_18435 [Lentisphaerae bacterium GWF2_49_21]HBC87118.1 hypothetical protein [Lentisphaeria bacterium]
MKCLYFIFILFILSQASIFADEYKETTFKDTNYRIYITDPLKIELYWKDKKTEKPLQRFSKVQAIIEAGGRKVVFMMNGGIFDQGNLLGLHIEDGAILNPLNLKDGDGNFYLKPNGVFFVDSDGKAGIMESNEYSKSNIQPKIALQSGPLLVQNGKIHPKFDPASKNHKHRNGVGIGKDGKIVFAITETGEKQKKFPSLYDFSEFFLSLGCDNALFLDGDLSMMVVNPEGKIKDGNLLGAIIAVSEKNAKKVEEPDKAP